MATSSDTVQLVLRAIDDTRGAFEHVTRGLDGIKERMRGVSEIAGGNILGGLGLQGIEGAVRGITDFGKGLVDTSADIELMRQRLNILYQSTAEGAQAFAFLKQNELTKPFDISSIMQSTTQLVAFKQNITTMLPALEDVAGAMGRSLPMAAQAFTDALEGRFSMLRRDLGISKEQLVQYGLEMNKAGHITNPESFTKAFLALANSGEFAGGADKLAHTWTGLMSSMRSQWTYFQANLGSGIFTVLEKQLGGLVHLLQDPKNAAGIQNLELALGDGLGRATVAVINFARMIGPYLGSYIVLLKSEFELIGRVVGTVFGYVAAAIGGFIGWFKGAALPVIETGVGMIAQWWRENGRSVEQSLVNIWNKIKDFGNLLVQGLRDVWNYAKADLQFWWDTATSLFQLGQDAITGNWGKFGTDFVNDTKKLASDAIQVFASLAVGFVDVITRLGFSLLEAMIPVANNLMGPWTWLAQGIRDVFTSIAPMVGAVIGGLGVGINTAMGAIVGTINGVIGAVNRGVHLATGAVDALIDRYDSIVGKIPGMGGHKIGKIGQSADVPMLDAPTLGSYGDINATVQRAMRGVGLNHDQQFTGIDPKKAQAAAEALRTALVSPFDTLVSTLAGKWQQALDPSAPHSAKAKQDALKLGKEIFGNMFSGFDGLGGNLTLDKWLKRMGITLDTDGAPGYNGKPLIPPGGDAGSPVPGSPALGASGSRTPAGRVSAGALGATFGQSVATLDRIGTDPATRAAQDQAATQRTQLSESGKQTLILTEVAGVLRESRDATRAVASLLLKSASPANQGNPLRRLGVARPVGI